MLYEKADIAFESIDEHLKVLLEYFIRELSDNRMGRGA
jgi:hypothetical protein